MCLSLILFFIMGIDKAKAIFHKWRIPEATLFILSFLGGFAGGFLGMFVFRHKIRKPIFYFVFTVSMLAHICILISLFGRYAA